MRQAAAAIWRGHFTFHNSSTYLVHEYLERKRLKGLGFVSDLSKLSADKAAAFLIIDDKFDQLEREKRKSESQKYKRGRR